MSLVETDRIAKRNRPVVVRLGARDLEELPRAAPIRAVPVDPGVSVRFHGERHANPYELPRMLDSRLCAASRPGKPPHRYPTPLRGGRRLESAMTRAGA